MLIVKIRCLLTSVCCYYLSSMKLRQVHSFLNFIYLSCYVKLPDIPPHHALCENKLGMFLLILEGVLRLADRIIMLIMLLL